MEENQVNAHFPVVLICGSAGSLEAMLQILPPLPAIVSYALVIVLHRKRGDDTTLEELIALKCSTPVSPVEDKTPLKPGSVYIAPADYHLLFEKNDTLSLDTSEKVNYSRPSLDVSLESAADVFGKSATGILLSGANADGTAGLIAIEKAGGKVLIQSPETAEIPFMPESAAQHIPHALLLDVADIRDFLERLDT